MRGVLLFLGFLFFIAGLVLMGFDVARLQGWTLSADVWIPLLTAWSVSEFWIFVSRFAAPGGATALAVGLSLVALSRRGSPASEEDEKIDAKAVGDWIRSFEQVQLQQRQNRQRPF